MTESADLRPLQAALATEHAVVYGYGIAGARLSGADRNAAVADLAAHETRRDDLELLVRSAGGQPVAAAPAYRLPFPVTTLAAARRLAAHLESASQGAAWDLVAGTAAGSPGRRSAVGWLTDSTVRGSRWGPVPALPGRP